LTWHRSRCSNSILARGIAAGLATAAPHDAVTRIKLLEAFDKTTKSALAHARALRISVV
jgi:hypothetical protein